MIPAGAQLAAAAGALLGLGVALLLVRTPCSAPCLSRMWPLDLPTLNRQEQRATL